MNSFNRYNKKLSTYINFDNPNLKRDKEEDKLINTDEQEKNDKYNTTNIKAKQIQLQNIKERKISIEVDENTNQQEMNETKIESNNMSIIEQSSTRRNSMRDSLNFDLKIFKANNYEKILAEKHLVISEKTININEVDEEGRNVLHRAALQQKIDIVKSISENISDPSLIDRKDKYGNTALLLTCKKFNFKKDNATRLDILKILLKKGADVNIYEPINNWTPLHWLAFNGDENSFSLLMNRGAVYFIPDKEGYFPIDLAGIKNYTKIVELNIQEFLKFMDKIGNFDFLDPYDINKSTSPLGNRRSSNQVDAGVELEMKEGADSYDQNESNNERRNSKNYNKGENFLKILNRKERKNKDRYRNVEIKSENPPKYTDSSDSSRSNNESNDESYNEDKPQTRIKTNLFIINPILQSVLIKNFSHHCLYWASYYKFNTMYVNKLITLYNADPAFKLFWAMSQTPLHGACLNGNIMAFKLLLNKYNEDEIIKIHRTDSKFNFFQQPNSVSINIQNDTKKQLQFEFIKNVRFIKKDPRFRNLTKKFKSYLVNEMRKLFIGSAGLKNLPHDKDLLHLKDKHLNTPLHLAASNGKIKFLKNLFETDLLEKPLDLFFNEINNEGFSGYALLKEEKFKNQILQNTGKIIYNIPLVVLELQNNPTSKNAINLIMKLAITEKLKVALMEHIDNTKVYICLDISDDIFKIQAEKEKLKIKLINKNLKKTFENNEDFLISAEPIFSRMKQEIIYKMISDVLDLKLLRDQKILIGIFYLHQPNVIDRIKKIWLDHPRYFPNPFRMFKKMILTSKEIFYDEINLLYRYFGEKIALYYAFFSFYLNYLSIIAVVGLGFALYYRENIYISYAMFPTYCITFLLWEIFFIEGWKRKNAEIIHKWGVNEIYKRKELRPGFKGDEYFKDLNGKLEKHDDKGRKILLVILGLPIVLGLLFTVIFTFFIATFFEQRYENTPLIKYIPGILKSLVIIIINKVFDIVARRFTDLENHKYEIDYENAIIAKIFSFRLVNDLTAAFYTTISTQNVENLKALLYSLIAIKLLTEPIISIGIPYLKLKWLKNNYFNKVRSMSQDKYKNKGVQNFSGNNKFETVDSYPIRSENNDMITLRKKEFANHLKEKFKAKNQKKSNSKGDSVDKIEKEQENHFNFEFFRKVKVVRTEQEKSYSTHEINPDFIEVNNLLQVRGDIILHYADICIIFTISSLFSIIIPLAPILVIVLSTISFNLKIYADIHLFKRPHPDRAINIGLWLNIFDMISTVSIIFNAFLYYYYNGNQFNVYSKYISKTVLANTITEFSIGEGESALLIIALAEHVIILIKYFIRYMVVDVPLWVSKERDVMLSILEESNREKEELHNEAIENVINHHMKLFASSIDAKNKEIYKLKENSNKNTETLKNYKNQLEIANSKISQVEFINKVLSDKNEKLESLKKEYTDYLNKKSTRDVKRVDSSLVGIQDFSPNNINNAPLRKMGQKEFQDTIDFTFDRILEKITRNILRGRQIVLQEEIAEMRNNINKLYIYNLFKNTFDSIEKEILVKKFGKCIKLIDNPIVVCNICNVSRVKYFCYNCEEKLCQSCKEVHLSNVLWEKHKCETIINENKGLNSNSQVVNENQSLTELNKQIKSNENIQAGISNKAKRFVNDNNHTNFNNNYDNDEETTLYRNIFRRRTFKSKKETRFTRVQDKGVLHKLKKGMIHSRKLYNNYAGGNILNHNSKQDLNTYSDLPNQEKKIEHEENFGLFLKMESFCFPVKGYNLNFDNLKIYFEYLKREYIDKNGISSENTVDTKKFIENKIDASARFQQNPNSAIQEDFTNVISNTIFNYEEQFLINRISFMKFKEYGAKLEVNNILEVLRILQESTYEEKLKILINLIDINSNKLIIKSEMEKLLVFMAIQNEKKNFRINTILDELFGKKNFIEYEKLYHSCLEDTMNRELFCEILQINE